MSTRTSGVPAVLSSYEKEATRRSCGGVRDRRLPEHVPAVRCGGDAADVIPASAEGGTQPHTCAHWLLKPAVYSSPLRGKSNVVFARLKSTRTGTLKAAEKLERTRFRSREPTRALRLSSSRDVRGRLALKEEVKRWFGKAASQRVRIVQVARSFY